MKAKGSLARGLCDERQQWKSNPAEKCEIIYVEIESNSDILLNISSNISISAVYECPAMFFGMNRLTFKSP